MSFLRVLLVAGFILAEFAVNDVLTSMTGSRIIGGETVYIDAYPYHVAVLNQGLPHCGGAIVHRNWVLTAAHCFDNIPLIFVSIRSGSSFKSTGGNVQKVNSRDIICHPQYPTPGYDIALVRVSESLIQENSVAVPVTLPYFNLIIPTGSIANVTGWGIWDALPWISYAPQLQAARLEIIDILECQEIYKDIMDRVPVTNNDICAISSNPRKRTGACHGDSGGPLVLNGILVGVVSRGWGCATLPGIFTNVVSFSQWISKITSI